MKKRRPPLQRASEYAWAAIAVAVIVSATLALWGFHRAGVSTADSIYDVLGLFAERFPTIQQHNWQLGVARFLAPLAVGAAGVKVLLSVLDDRLDKVRARHLAKNHVVVCGLGRRGMTLVEAFRAQGRRVVAVACEADGPQIAAARERGALVIAGDATDPLVLERAGLTRADHLVVVGPDDATNVEIAMQADALVPADRAVTAIVQVDGDELCRALQESSALRSSPGGCSLEFVNFSERGAHALLRRYPPFEAERPHLLVVGLDRSGAAVVVAAARLWRTLSQGGERAGDLRITAVDPQAARLLVLLARRHPALAAVDLIPAELPVASVGFENGHFPRSTAGEPPVSYGYVCLEDPAEALAAGLRLRDALAPSVPLVVQVPSESESAGRFLGRPAERSHGFAIFGLVEETCTPELLLDTTVETLARAQHEDYLRSQAGETQVGVHLAAWDELDEWVREENRAWARDVGRKLNTVGCGLHHLSELEAPLFVFDDDEAELLAELEHERWMSRRLASGWRHGPVRDDAAKIHPDIVPWDKLSEADKEKDRRTIVSLPRFLALPGYGIHRLADAPDTLARRRDDRCCR